MIDNPEEQLQRVVNRLRKVVEDYSTQVLIKDILQILSPYIIYLASIRIGGFLG